MDGALAQASWPSTNWQQFWQSRQVAQTDAGGTTSGQVKAILERVAKEGDQALLELTRQLDGWSPKDGQALRVPPSLLQSSHAALDPELKESLAFAAQRIEAFHRRQLAEGFADWQLTDSIQASLGQRYLPVESAGVYVPAGSAPLISTLLMTVIPAKVAGVKRIAVVSPTPAGKQSAAIYAAAWHLGVDEVWQLGGAQALAGLAFGTESVQAVDCIVGPGNSWVVEAKRQLYGQVGIDLLAGPSEVVVIADDSADPRCVAADLCAQAEHDEQAQSVLISPSQDFIDRVQAILPPMLEQLARGSVIRQSFANRGAAILVEDIAQAVELSNLISPEHLQLCLAEPDTWVAAVRHAGALFVGHSAAEVFSDYVAGLNHVLPTGGSARFCSGLGVEHFLRRQSVFRATQAVGQALSQHAERLAQAEGLGAHALAAKLRGG